MPALLLLLVAVACPTAALAARLCVEHPGAFTAIGAASLAVLAALAVARLRREPRPEWYDVLAAAALGATLVVSVALGGYVSHSSTDHALLRRAAVGWAALTCALTAFLLRHAAPAPLRAAFFRAIGPEPLRGRHVGAEAPPRRHALTYAFVPLWAVQVALLSVWFPPLLTIDSAVNFSETPFFEHGRLWHHPPGYPVVLKALATGPRFLEGLVAITLLQHALVLFLAFAVERLVRLETGSALAAAIAGLFLAVDPHFAIYAHSIMTETLSIALGAGAVLLVVEGTRREAAGPWLVAAAACATAATLTRQVFELWPGVVVIALLLTGGVRPRVRAAATFLAATYLPLAVLLVHNWVYYDRAALTAATGRNLIYRVCTGMPDLTDPDAPPGDETERARRLIWANRDDLWAGPYNAVMRELGWYDDRIDAAVQRFWVEQIRRHPGPFARVTADYAGKLLAGDEAVNPILEFHDKVVPILPPPCDEVPLAVRPARIDLYERYTGLEPTSRLLVLLLAAASPLLARGRARAVALLSVGTIAYFVLVTALAEEPLFRYRLPVVPSLLCATAAAVTGLAARLRNAPAQR